MKKKTIKTLKRISRERIPSLTLKGKILPSKKKKLVEKMLDKPNDNL